MGKIWHTGILTEPTCELPSEEQTNHTKCTKFTKIQQFWPNNKVQYFAKIGEVDIDAQNSIQASYALEQNILHIQREIGQMITSVFFI